MPKRKSKRASKPQKRAKVEEEKAVTKTIPELKSEYDKELRGIMTKLEFWVIPLIGLIQEYTGPYDYWMVAKDSPLKREPSPANLIRSVSSFDGCVLLHREDIVDGKTTELESRRSTDVIYMDKPLISELALTVGSPFDSKHPNLRVQPRRIIVQSIVNGALIQWLVENMYAFYRAWFGYKSVTGSGSVLIYGNSSNKQILHFGWYRFDQKVKCEFDINDIELSACEILASGINGNSFDYIDCAIINEEGDRMYCHDSELDAWWYVKQQELHEESPDDLLELEYDRRIRSDS